MERMRQGRSAWLRAAGLAVAVASVLGGCAAKGPILVPRLSPRPGLELLPSREPLGFALAKEVPDEGVVGTPPNQLQLANWHATLQEAFGTAFRGGFDVVRGEDKPERTFTILEATPTLVVDERGKVGAVIRYHATLNGTRGVALRRMEGEAPSKFNGVRSDAAAAVESAVETMFEDLGAQFFDGKVKKPSLPTGSEGSGEAF